MTLARCPLGRPANSSSGQPSRLSSSRTIRSAFYAPFLLVRPAGIGCPEARCEAPLVLPLVDTTSHLGHSYCMTDATTVFRTSVPVRRLRRAEKILQRLGLSTADAVNMLLAQIEIRQGLPFDVRMASKPLLSAEQQAAEWTKGFDAY